MRCVKGSVWSSAVEIPGRDDDALDFSSSKHLLRTVLSNKTIVYSISAYCEEARICPLLLLLIKPFYEIQSDGLHLIRWPAKLKSNAVWIRLLCNVMTTSLVTLMLFTKNQEPNTIMEKAKTGENSNGSRGRSLQQRKARAQNENFMLYLY